MDMLFSVGQQYFLERGIFLDLAVRSAHPSILHRHLPGAEGIPMKQDAGYEKRLVLRIARELADMLPENPDRRRRVLELVHQLAAAEEQAAFEVKQRS
jgi:hypothetical protein